MDRCKDIDGNILKVLNGTASEEERKFVDQWIHHSNENRYQFQKLRLVWDERTLDSKLIGHEEQKKKIWRAYAAELHLSQKLPTIPLYRRTWLRIAVMLAIFLFPIYSLYFQNAPIIEKEPGLITSIRKSNPMGQKSLIHLPDGSKVWLNSQSAISYQEHFSDSIRFVSLEGEAYFDVVNDSLRPFVVDFESLSVTVLGTEFNISAFKTDQDLLVTLVEGSVEISNTDRSSSLVLAPGTGLIYSKEKNDYREFSKNSNPELFYRTTEWRNGKLIFDGHNFDDFVGEIERWYGVQVHVSGIPPVGWNIRSTFENEVLSNVMDAISYNKGFSYSINDKKLTIMFN
jgi:transmembrane sensor